MLIKSAGKSILQLTDSWKSTPAKSHQFSDLVILQQHMFEHNSHITMGDMTAIYLCNVFLLTNL